MNLKEQIISEGIGYRGPNFDVNYFYSNLAQGFLKDKAILGEDVVQFYTDIFGEEAAPIFESFDLDSDMLQEAVAHSRSGLLFETDGKNFSTDKPVAGNWRKAQFDQYKNSDEYRANQASDVGIGNMHAKANQDAQFSIKPKGMLTTLWDGIKKFGSSVATKFPGVASFLKNGIGWITAHPAIVLGTAGGAALIAGVIRALTKHGDKKKAAELQAKLDAAKSKGKAPAKE